MKKFNYQKNHHKHINAKSQNDTMSEQDVLQGSNVINMIDAIEKVNKKTHKKGETLEGAAHKKLVNKSRHQVKVNEFSLQAGHRIVEIHLNNLINTYGLKAVEAKLNQLKKVG